METPVEEVEVEEKESTDLASATGVLCFDAAPPPPAPLLMSVIHQDIFCLVDPSKGKVAMRVIRNPQPALSPFFVPSPFCAREQTRSKIELHPGSHIFALAPSCRSNRGGDPKMDYFR